MSTRPLQFSARTHPSRPAGPSGATWAHRPSRPVHGAGARGRRSAQVANSVEHQAALAFRLTERDRWMARMVFEHRVLHAGQISAVAFPSPNAGRRRLQELHHWSVFDRFRPRILDGSAPQHYVLGPAGADVLAGEHGLDTKTLGYRRERAMSIVHSPRLAHTVGLNGWFLSLVARAVWAQAGESLCAWWSEQRCARYFGDLVRPDGYGRWYEPDSGESEFFLEYDRGTETTTTLAHKLDGYAQLAASTGIATPVLVWLPSTSRETHIRTMLARAWRSLNQPQLVPVATAAASRLEPQNPVTSPAEPLWLPLSTTTPTRDGARYRLGTLRTAWPHLPAVPPSRDEANPAQPRRRRGMLPAVPPMPPPASPTTRRNEAPARG